MARQLAAFLKGFSFFEYMCEQTIRGRCNVIDITPDPEWELAPFNESGHAQEATPE